MRNTLIASNKSKTQTEGSLGPLALCTLWLPWKTQQIHGRNCFTYPGKKYDFHSVPNPCKIWHSCGDVCDMQPTVWLSNSKNFFRRWSAHRRAFNKPDTIDDSDQMALPRHYSVSWYYT